MYCYSSVSLGAPEPQTIPQAEDILVKYSLAQISLNIWTNVERKHISLFEKFASSATFSTSQVKTKY